KGRGGVRLRAGLRCQFAWGAGTGENALGERLHRHVGTDRHDDLAAVGLEDQFRLERFCRRPQRLAGNRDDQLEILKELDEPALDARRAAERQPGTAGAAGGTEEEALALVLEVQPCGAILPDGKAAEVDRGGLDT